jgi:hypothetical protein
VRQSAHGERGVILVHAGNRLDDARRSPSRLPDDHVDTLGRRLAELVDVLQPLGVVTAIAGGADLLMAEAARGHDVPLHVVLPFGRERFRQQSVADQGERWVASYDRIIEWVTADDRCSLVELDLEPTLAGYSAGNEALLERARTLDPTRLLAVAVRHREPDAPSVTDHFVDRSRAAGLFVIEVDPLDVA